MPVSNILQTASLGSVKLGDIHFRSALPMWLLGLLLLAALAYAIFMYRRQPLLAPWMRALLAVLRFAAVAALVVMMFAPVAEVQVEESESPAVMVLLDGSASMDNRDVRREAEELAEAATALGKQPFPDPARQQAIAKAAWGLRRSAGLLSQAAADDAKAHRARIQQALAEAADAVERSVKDGLLPPESVAQLSAIVKDHEQNALLVDESQNRPDELAPLAARQRAIADSLERLNAEWLAGAASVSEDLKPGLAGVARVSMVESALRHPDFSLLGELSRHCQLRIFRFGRQIDELAGPDLANGALRPVRDTDDGTCLGTAMERAMATCLGQPIAGAVVFTDGAATGGLDPMDAAERFRIAGVPLFTIGVGLPKPYDVRLQSLAVQEVAFAKDLVRVRAYIVSNGYENRTGTVRVDLDGSEAVSKTFVFRGASQVEEMFFNAGKDAAVRNLKVSVAEMPGEVTAANNSLEQSLRVVDDKIRVLFIEGSPRWEYRYLVGILKRDPRMEVRFITTEGDLDTAKMSREHLARFPTDKAEAFKYDLVIVGDARASTFSPGDFELLDALVREKGGSLIVLAGKKHLAEYVATPMAAMLPVWITADEAAEIDQDVYPKLTIDGENSTLMSLTASESKNKAIWTKVKPLGWIPSLAGAKPGATVLAELSDVSKRIQAFPLIAWHRCGAGKVLFVGTDRLFRLRQKAGDQYHRRFWSQSVQFLTLSRLLGENKRVRLEVDRTDPRVGERVEIFADVVDESYEPATASSYPVYVCDFDGQGLSEEVYLEPVPAMAGLFRGTYTPTRTGRRKVVPAKQDEAVANAVVFDVGSASSEQADSSMQQDLLVRMAEMTGGRHLTIRELPALAEYLKANAARRTARKEMELWDLWIFPAAIFTLLGVEWLLRRRKDLA